MRKARLQSSQRSFRIKDDFVSFGIILKKGIFSTRTAEILKYLQIPDLDSAETVVVYEDGQIQ